MADQISHAECLVIVDGDVLVRHVLSDYLRTCGYVVVEAASTDEASIVLDHKSTKVIAVLCDVNAPGCRSAFQFRAWALQVRPHVEVTLAGSVAAAAGKAAEFCDEGPHLGRPYDPQSVVEYIRRLTGARAPGRITSA